jgi:hypothetical protein
MCVGVGCQSCWREWVELGVCSGDMLDALCLGREANAVHKLTAGATLHTAKFCRTQHCLGCLQLLLGTTTHITSSVLAPRAPH